MCALLSIQLQAYGGWAACFSLTTSDCPLGNQPVPHLCLCSMAVAEADLANGPPPWTPTLPSSEVTVTDITANSVTVTFREAQAAEGFFRDRSGKL